MPTMTGSCRGWRKPEPDADLCRAWHHARGPRCDQPPARWQSADWSGSRRPELLVLLRHTDRHRLGAGADARTGAMDGAWGGGHLDAGLRPTPVWELRRTKEWQVIKAKEDYCLRHEIPFPHFNRLAGRPDQSPRRSMRHLKAKGRGVRGGVMASNARVGLPRAASNNAITTAFAATVVR